MISTELEDRRAFERRARALDRVDAVTRAQELN
jgi:hypothetical protein